MSFAQTSAGVEDTSKKNLIKAIITKKNFQDPLLLQNTKDDEKKSSKYKNIESKKSFKKKSTKFDHEKKSTKPLQKPKS
jgi:hypothetical protein